MPRDRVLNRNDFQLKPGRYTTSSWYIPGRPIIPPLLLIPRWQDQADSHLVMSSTTTTHKHIGGRVAVVGTGSRAAMFIRGIVARPSSSVVAILEPNSIRAKYYNDLLVELGANVVPVYQPDQYKEMLQKEKVESVVITTIDALHHLYIIPALEAGGTQPFLQSNLTL